MIKITISIITAFVTTLVTTPYAIRYFKFVRLTTTDVHKKSKPLLPNSAGIPVVIGIMAGLLVYIFLIVFSNEKNPDLVTLFAAISSILIIMVSGFIDDLNSKQVKVDGYIEGKGGLKAWQKPLLTLPAALPLIAIMAGETSIVIPLIGTVNFGILYPLLIVPIGIVCASNMTNMLGGYNGLEAGMGLIYTLGLGVFSLVHGGILAGLILLVTSGALASILIYNWFPAKILSGDSLTYTLGAIVAISAIIGNMERAAILVMLPFIIQGVLKFYSKFKLGHFASDLGVLQKDGTIKPKYDKIYSLTHAAMRIGKSTERQIVLKLMLVQLFCAILPFFFY